MKTLWSIPLLVHSCICFDSVCGAFPLRADETPVSCCSLVCRLLRWELPKLLRAVTKDGYQRLCSRILCPFLSSRIRLGWIHLQAEGQVQPEQLQRCGEEEGRYWRNVSSSQTHRLQWWEHFQGACVLRMWRVSWVGGTPQASFALFHQLM